MHFSMKEESYYLELPSLCSRKGKLI